MTQLQKSLSATAEKTYITKAFVSTLLVLFLCGCKPVTSLGKNPSGESLRYIESLPNYRDGQFHNLESNAAPVGARRKMQWTGFLKYFFRKPEKARPSFTLPIMVTNLKKPVVDKPQVVWFGHSTVLLKTSGASILFDPIFNHYAGPFPGMVKAFDGTTFFNTDDLPPIDALVISHDHYDHLDYTTVKQLHKKVKRVIVPVGVGSHFIRWGFDPKIITELNWNDSVTIDSNVQITATPAHHRSNRTFEQRKTLWSSYVIKANEHKIYFSGDTGYSKHFSLIGAQHGPFDIALLECGQYNEKWSQSHMFPWQTARAALDLKTGMVIPIHWGKFAESTHPWNEPVKRLLKSSDSLGIPVSVPFMGEPFAIGDAAVRDNWWQND